MAHPNSIYICLNQVISFVWLASQLIVRVCGLTIDRTFPQQLTSGAHSSMFVFWKQYGFYPCCILLIDFPNQLVW